MILANIKLLRQTFEPEILTKEDEPKARRAKVA
jgi:hypothetical protein